MSARQTLIALLVVGLVGGSLTTGCERERRSIPESESFVAQLSLYNSTSDAIPLTLWGLAPDHSIDCHHLGDPLSALLSDDHLRQLSSTTILSGQELPVSHHGFSEPEDSPGDCPFVILTADDDRLPPRLLSWPSDLPERQFFSEIDAPQDLPTDEPSLVIDADYPGEAPAYEFGARPCDGDLDTCSDDHLQEILEPTSGAHYRWQLHGDALSLHDWQPSELDDHPTDDGDRPCAAGHQDPPLNWDSPPSGTWIVDAIEPLDDDHCHLVDLREASEDSEDADLEPFELCAGPVVAERLSPPELDGHTAIQFYVEEQTSSSSPYQTLNIEMERRDDQGEPFARTRMELIRGHTMPDHLGLDWEALPATDCSLYRESSGCAQLSWPLLLVIDAGDSITVEVGALQALDLDARRSLYLHRGLHRLITDRGCSDEVPAIGQSIPGPYLEAIYFGAHRELPL